jgi:hypothetical protein
MRSPDTNTNNSSRITTGRVEMIQSHQNYVTGATPTSDVPASQGEVFDMEVALPSFHKLKCDECPFGDIDCSNGFFKECVE